MSALAVLQPAFRSGRFRTGPTQGDEDAEAEEGQVAMTATDVVERLGQALKRPARPSRRCVRRGRCT